MRKKWKLIYKGDIDAFDNSESLSYWRERSSEEKFVEVSRLIHEAQMLKGNLNYDESRLFRFTAVIKRI